MGRRVVVTGLGAITPIGNTAEEFWRGIRENKVGIGPITRFDTTDYKVKLAAEVKGFDPKDYMDFLDSKGIENVKVFTDDKFGHTWMNARYFLDKSLRLLFK